MEQWKDIEGYEGIYQISSLGRIKSLPRTFYSGKNHHIKKTYPEKMMKPKRYETGYLYIDLCANSQVKRFKIHRLVAKTFIPNPENKPCIDHINAVRDDNRMENLRWVDNFENMRNPYTRSAQARNKTGDKNPMMKYCRPVLQIDPETGKTIAEFPSVKEAARQLGICSGNISRCCNLKRKCCNGFIFRFKSNY